MAQPPGIDDAPPTATSIFTGPKSPEELENLIAKATAKYAVKDYDAAAEEYSRAVELQAELNGEMSPRNADLLYLYGRCLYHVAVENSDVLGAQVAKEEKQKKKTAEGATSKKGKAKNANHEGGTMLKGGIGRGPNGEHLIAIEEGPDGAPEEKADTSEIPEEIKTEDQKKANAAEGSSKPYFTFTGDENWDDSDDEEVAEGEEEDDPEDDFSNAFEVLDIARVLLEKRIAELEDRGKDSRPDPKAGDIGHSVLDVRKLKERLADTRDLQAEISLEAERFGDATTDLKAALEMKKGLYEVDTPIIAEAHYKLSLALEFSAISLATDEAGNPQPGTVGKVDQTLRDEAAVHMEEAIASCKTRLAKEEKALTDPEFKQADTSPDKQGGKKPEVTQQSIDEVKEIIADMEQRLKELKEPPVDVNAAAAQPDAAELTGILGSLIGGSSEEQKAKLAAAVTNANDLSGLVKKKKSTGAEKRKADGAEAEGSTAAKKPKQDE